MYLKRLIHAFLCLFVSAGVIFAGGGAQGDKKPAGAEKQALVIALPSHAFVTDYENNYQTQYLEKLNDVDIEFYLLPTVQAEARTKVALMVTSNDLPDLLLANLTNEQILEYGSNGAFIALNKYINDPAKSPYFYAIPEKDRAEIIRAMTSADGNIYTSVRFEPESWNMTPHREYINQAWLNKLGLKVPTTTDELRNVLLAFRDRDPNGNGKKDEIGLYGYFKGTYGENVISAIINSFVFYTHVNLALDASGKRVIAPFTEPGFRKALTYLNTLYKDGVLAASLFTDDQQQFRATLGSSNPPVVGFTSAGSVANWAQAETNPNFLEMAMIPPLTGPDGICYTPQGIYSPSTVGNITSKSKVQDLAWKVLDSFFDHDVSIINRFGQEDVDWTRKPELLAQQTNAYVSLGLYPSVSLIEMTYIWSEPSAQFWHNLGPRYASEAQGNTRGSLTRPYVPDSKVAILDGYNYKWYIDKHPEHMLPPIKFSAEDARKNSEPITNINEYVRQVIAEFTTGTRDINNNAAWTAYLRDLDGMGLQQWITSTQTAYDKIKK